MKTIKVEFDFDIPDGADAEATADAIFDVLCSLDEDSPFHSCNGWTLTGEDGNNRTDALMATIRRLRAQVAGGQEGESDGNG
jgi:hypothetical protein